MQGYQYQSEFARKYYNQGREEGIERGREEGIEKGREEGIEKGREEGIEKGREEGIEKGREEGRQEGLQAAVLAFARSRLASVTADDAAAVEALHDERILTELIDALARAGAPSEIRAAFDRLVHRSPEGARPRRDG